MNWKPDMLFSNTAKVLNKQTNKQTNNNDLLEKDGGTKSCIYKD